MIGVIAGDVIGSVHEHSLTKSMDFPLFDPLCRFTDDTVLTVATAYAILTGSSYEMAYRDFGRRHPDAGYGGTFYQWLLSSEPRPYNSWGNGSAMRVAPVGFAFGSVDEVLRQAEQSAAVTHSHLEGIKGAQATALAVFMGRSGASKEEIRGELVRRFGSTFTAASTRSARLTSGTSRVNDRCQKRLSPSWIPLTLSTRSVWRYHSAGTATRRRQSQEASPTPFTDMCHTRLSVPFADDCPGSFST